MRGAFILGFVGLTAFFVSGQVALYDRCGGEGWTGATTCVNGAVCTHWNHYYWQCISAGTDMTTAGASTTPTKPTTCATPTTTSPHSAPATTSSSSTTSTSSHSIPTTTSSRATTSTSSRATTSTSSRATSTTSTSVTPTSSCGAPPASAGKLRYAGVNIAGFDFGINTNGEGTASAAYPPLTQYNGANGPGQMTHFKKDDKYNVFRLPVGLQYLTNNDVATGKLDTTNSAVYDVLVEACLTTGASCIIDIHNYARWNGAIIGQGGPTNEVFASLWGSLAGRYANKTQVVFGIMNEPHNLGLETWAGTVQACVTAIREAGATTQMILLPGSDYASAKTFISGGSAAALSTVTNPDGSYTNLVFDVHRYLDSDGSGSSDTCVTNNIADVWEPLAQWLRCNGRQVLITETGGGNTASCERFMCEEIKGLAKHSDVILGYVGWAAGNFATTYTLSETPTKNGNTWSDQPLVAMCMAPSVNGYLA